MKYKNKTYWLVLLVPLALLAYGVGVSAATDVTPPIITELRTTQGELETSGVPVLYFAATDEESGVSHFEASFNGGKFIKVENPYPLDLVQSKSSIVLRVYDKAGNITSSDTEFSPPQDKPYQKERQKKNSLYNALGILTLALIAWRLWRYLYHPQ